MTSLFLCSKNLEDKVEEVTMHYIRVILLVIFYAINCSVALAMDKLSNADSSDGESSTKKSNYEQVLKRLKDKKFSGQITGLINEELLPLIDSLNEKQLLIVITVYSELIKKNPELLTETHEIVVKFPVAIRKLNNNKEIISAINEKFNFIQETIRSLDKYHNQEPQAYSNKDLEPYLVEFQNATWEKKTEILYQLARLLINYEEKHLISAVEVLSTLLLIYSDHLMPIELHKLRYACLSIGMYEEASKLNILLQKIKNISEMKDEAEIKLVIQQIQLLKPKTPKRSPKSIKNNSSDISNRKIKLHISHNSKNKTLFVIKMPIDKGLGKIALELKKSALFRGAHTNLLLLFSRIIKPEIIKTNEILYKQGTRGEDFALIVRGAVGVYFANERGEEIELSTLKDNQSVGEMSLFSNNASRSATVRAKKETKLLRISTHSLRQFVNYEPALLHIIFDQLVTKAYYSRQKLDALNIPREFDKSIFKLLDPHHSKVLSRKSIETIHKNDFKIKGADTLFYVCDGQITLRNNMENVGTLVQGDYSDDLAFLQKGGQALFCMEGNNCTLWSITRENFFDWIKRDVDIMWGMAADLSTIINTNNTKLKNTPAYDLQKACETDDIKLALEALNAGADINAPCPVLGNMAIDSKPIHVAAKYSIEVLKLLLDNDKLKVDAQDGQGNSAVHIAVEENRFDALKLLHEHHAKLDLPNNQKDTPMKIACRKQFRELSYYLSKEGISIEESSALPFSLDDTLSDITSPRDQF